jgi:hypothetical protein
MSERHLGSGQNIGGIEDKLLSEMARPDIYRINAFRILEVLATASAREISAQARKLDLTEKLGNTGGVERGILPLNPPPDGETRRTAAQRLSDPESRLVDEMFWFWPLSPGTPGDIDKALGALKQGDLQNAVAIWNQHETQSSEANVSMHNLAILYHLLALDLEQILAERKLTAEQAQQKWEYWKAALDRWRILVDYDGFWKRLTERVRELDDPRLTSGTVKRIREGLPYALLSINAVLASRAAKKGNRDEAWSQTGLMRNYGFGSVVFDKAISKAAAPIREQIKIICANGEKETAKDPEQGEQVARQVLAQTSPLLMTIDTLLPPKHPILEAAHDEVALCILGSAIIFGNKTENLAPLPQMLSQAMQIAASESIRQRINENLETVKTNLEYVRDYTMCWFCKKRPGDDKAVHEVKMYGDVHRVGNQVQYRTLKLPVPRCGKCKSAHKVHSVMSWPFMVLGGIVGLAGGFLGMAVGAGIGYGIGWILGRLFTIGFKPESFGNQFPMVKKSELEGWTVGEKPQGVQ